MIFFIFVPNAIATIGKNYILNICGTGILPVQRLRQARRLFHIRIKFSLDLTLFVKLASCQYIS